MSAANAILSDPERKQAYDTGSDLRQEHYDEVPLVDQVESYYFPERQGWRAFGDPHKGKRDAVAKWKRDVAAAREEEERRQQEEERALLGAVTDESSANDGVNGDDESANTPDHDEDHDEL